MTRNRLLIAVLLALITLPAFAQSATHSTYVVKFLCGFTDGRVPRLNDPSPLPAPYRGPEPGNYGTLINIKSVTFTSNTVNISKFAIIKGPTSQALSLGNVTLQPGEVLTVDCTDITTRLSQPPGNFNNDGRFVEGYVQISHRIQDPVILQLDVTAAYTYAIQKAETNGIGLGSSLQVVTIPPRNIFQPE